MVAIIRNLRVPDAVNAAPYKPIVWPNLIVRVRAEPPKKEKKPEKTALGEFVAPRTEHVGWHRMQPTRPLDVIVRIVCEVWNVARNDLMSPRRYYRYSHPRQAAYLLAKEFTTKSYPEIGRYFDRDHTTIMYGVEGAQNRKDPEYQSLLDEARSRLREIIS